MYRHKPLSLYLQKNIQVENYKFLTAISPIYPRTPRIHCKRPEKFRRLKSLSNLQALVKGLPGSQDYDTNITRGLDRDVTSCCSAHVVHIFYYSRNWYGINHNSITVQQSTYMHGRATSGYTGYSLLLAFRAVLKVYVFYTCEFVA